jgi:hypothetical protein
MRGFLSFWIINLSLACYRTGFAEAQEVKFVDLTTIEPRIALRMTPPPPQQIHTNPDGSFSVTGSARGMLIGDCGVGANEPRALKTTVTWLDRRSYAEGDSIEWEVKVENVGSAPMTLGISPHLSDLQPPDASEPFSYEETGVGLSVRDEHGVIDLAHVSVYGSDSQPGTLLELKVGEWVRLRSRSKLSFPNIRNAHSLQGEAIAQFWLHHGEITPAPGTYGTGLVNRCPRASEGVGPHIVVSRKISGE